MAVVVAALTLGPATAAVADSPPPTNQVFGTTVIDGYTGDQLDNAQAIITAATRLHLDTAAQILGVTAAIGESSLHNIDHGDNAINPDGTAADSLGLFQQQHWWGTPRERMEPAVAATRFYQALETVPDWRLLAPTIAIHAVQGNADPNHYTVGYPAAVDIVTYLDGHPYASPSSPATPTAAGNALDFGPFPTITDTIATDVADSLSGSLAGADR